MTELKDLMLSIWRYYTHTRCLNDSHVKPRYLHNIGTLKIIIINK